MQTQITEEKIKQETQHLEDVIAGWSKYLEVLKDYAAELDAEISRTSGLERAELKIKRLKTQEEIDTKEYLIKKKADQLIKFEQTTKAQQEVLSKQEKEVYETLARLPGANVDAMCQGLQIRYGGQSWESHGHRWADFQLAAEIIQKARAAQKQAPQPKLHNAKSKYHR